MKKDVCVPSKWVDKNDDTVEMAAPMAILLLVCTNPAQSKLYVYLPNEYGDVALIG